MEAKQQPNGVWKRGGWLSASQHLFHWQLLGRAWTQQQTLPLGRLSWRKRRRDVVVCYGFFWWLQWRNSRVNWSCASGDNINSKIKHSLRLNCMCGTKKFSGLDKSFSREWSFRWFKGTIPQNFATGWTRERCVGLPCSFVGTLLQFRHSVQRWGTCCYHGCWSLCWWLLDNSIASSRSWHWLLADHSERRAESRNTGHTGLQLISLCAPRT